MYPAHRNGWYMQGGPPKSSKPLVIQWLMSKLRCLHYIPFSLFSKPWWTQHRHFPLPYSPAGQKQMPKRKCNLRDKLRSPSSRVQRPTTQRGEDPTWTPMESNLWSAMSHRPTIMHFLHSVHAQVQSQLPNHIPTIQRQVQCREFATSQPSKGRSWLHPSVGT